MNTNSRRLPDAAPALPNADLLPPCFIYMRHILLNVKRSGEQMSTLRTGRHSQKNTHRCLGRYQSVSIVSMYTYAPQLFPGQPCENDDNGTTDNIDLDISRNTKSSTKPSDSTTQSITSSTRTKLVAYVVPIQKLPILPIVPRTWDFNPHPLGILAVNSHGISRDPLHGSTGVWPRGSSPSGIRRKPAARSKVERPAAAAVRMAFKIA